MADKSALDMRQRFISSLSEADSPDTDTGPIQEDASARGWPGPFLRNHLGRVWQRGILLFAADFSPVLRRVKVGWAQLLSHSSSTHPPPCFTRFRVYRSHDTLWRVTAGIIAFVFKRLFHREPVAPPPPDSSQRPSINGQSVVEILYSSSQRERAIITCDVHGTYRVLTAFWDTSDWKQSSLAFWTEPAGSTFADTLDIARIRASEILGRLSSNKPENA